MSQEAPDPFHVNVIIPARNAGETITATLESLLAQTHCSWQAIVVNDGSTDDTAAITARFVSRDPRISVLTGPQRGVSAARNLGLSAATAPWILFLDADDTIVPEMLEKMLAGLRADPGADAIHCGWTCTDPDGRPVESRRCEVLTSELFPLFSNYCAFIIHACIIRRSQLVKIGGFDESLSTSEDFDLWQRASRIGTSFIHIPEFLSIYRLRPNSTWFNSGPFLDDVLRVVRRGHTVDPRLPSGLVPPRYVDGSPAGNLPAAEVKMIMWAAAMAIARDEDPVPLLNRSPSPPASAIDPHDFAARFFRAIPFTLCQHESAWLELFPVVSKRIAIFLEKAEQSWNVPKLRARTLEALEDQIVPAIAVRSTSTGEAVVFSATAILSIDVESPIDDFLSPRGTNRVVCVVRAEGQSVGMLTFPVISGTLPSIVIADAIAGRFAWPLLELFLLRQDIYSQITVVPEDAGWNVKRSGVSVALFSDDPGSSLHDRVGWTLFLQELFDRKDLTSADFYGSANLHPDLQPRTAEDESVFELTQPIQSIRQATSDSLTLRGTLGGAPVAVAQVPTIEGTVSEADIRLALLASAGMELVRTAVREAILGRSFADRGNLHRRLQEAAPRRRGSYVRSLVGSGEGSVAIMGAANAVGSRPIARRLTLPAAKADLILEAASALQPLLRVGEGAVRQVLYLPELQATPKHDAQTTSAEAIDQEPRALHDRHHFESLFASAADPWQYTSPYEQRKYEQTLTMLPKRALRKALEIGCAEGHFTAQLLPLVESLVISDISKIALERTLKRCASPKISARQSDLAHEPINGKFDLIVCSEILYYMGDRSALALVARKLADAVEPGGYLIAAHANQVQDDPDAPGFDWGSLFGAKVIGETFAALSDLIFEEELQTPLYRIQRFRRRRGLSLLRFGKPSAKPRHIQLAENAAPEPAAAAGIALPGLRLRELDSTVTTANLPILMYHNVASAGPARLDRWRVTPAAFAAQIDYLKQAGFSPVTLKDWESARRSRKPLPGRRVLITFDDGYEGFEESVLPALQSTGYSALLFVPTDHVGGRAVWDGIDGQQLQLMDWNALRRLRDAGITFGAHSRTHRQLTGLSAEDLVDELAGARLALRRELQIEADAIAYPFGASDEAVMRLAGACGYTFALTTREGASGFDEDALGLSRIEVMGHYTLEQFIAKLA